MKPLRQVFGETLSLLMESNKEIIPISCDLQKATGLSFAFEKFPDRCLEVGIAEANAVGISTGLALSGFIPVLASFGSFITGKNIEIRVSISYNSAPVKIIGTHGGFIGPDGATQSATQDISVMRSRDPEVWKTADFLVDVGGVYDLGSNKFDHHQEGT